MNHFDLVIEALRPIFEGHGFGLAERYTNYARFESQFASVAIGYDKRDKSNSIFVGERNSNSHLLDEKNLKDVFGHNDVEQIRTQPLDKFVSDFLSNRGRGILTGDPTKLQELDDYEKERSRVYTNDLVKRQNIRIADNAWGNRDYLTFVKHIDLVDKGSLPKSYALKYKMARDRIGGVN